MFAIHFGLRDRSDVLRGNYRAGMGLGNKSRYRQGAKSLTNNARATHTVRGFSLKFKQVQRAIEQNCSFVWVDYGRTFRDATPVEAIEMRNKHAAARKLSQEVLVSSELPGLRFVLAGTTYQQPREAYEEMEAPLGVRKCMWPRKSNTCHTLAVQ